MGNLESAARNDCELLNCESGANEVHADPPLELLYWKITVWSTCPAPLWKFETASSRPGKKKKIGSVLGPFSEGKRDACFTVGGEKRQSGRLALLVSGIVSTVVRLE